MDFMNRASAWLDQLNADPDTVRLLVLAGLTLTAFLLTWLLTLPIRRSLDPVQARVRRSGGYDQGRARRLAERFVERVGREVAPKDTGKRQRVATKLVQAGFRSARALPVFFGAKLLGILAIAPATAYLFWQVKGLPVDDAVLYGVILGLLSFLAPDMVLHKLWQKRQLLMRRALPDALDMLVVCTEAGLGLNASIDRVASEIDVQHPELAEEMLNVTRQMRAGLDSGAALQGLVERVGLEEMRSLVATMLQAMRFGTGVADSLRVYAEDLRDKRLQSVEEQAAKLEGKMLAPIGLLILPGFLLVAVGPALMKLARALGDMSR